MPFHMKQNRVVLTKLYLGNSSTELISTRSCRIKGKQRFWKIPNAKNQESRKEEEELLKIKNLKIYL